jgi:phosphate acetyltransferase
MSKPDFASIRVGDKFPSVSISITQELINQYADICGDYNSIHLDVEGMKNHPIFKGTIAYGTINVEPILQSIGAFQGTGWPVEGTKLDLQFRAPVRPGDTITGCLTVKEKKTIGGKNIVICDMTSSNAAGACVVGTAEIVVP